MKLPPLSIADRIGQIAVLAKNAGKMLLNHSTSFRCERKFSAEPAEAVTVPANAIRARLLINGNVGLPECVDRLHRIADVERQSTARQPPKCQADGPAVRPERDSCPGIHRQECAGFDIRVAAPTPWARLPHRLRPARAARIPQSLRSACSAKTTLRFAAASGKTSKQRTHELPLRSV